MLPPGVLIQLHDVYLPDDYPPQLASLLFGEQLLLTARLLSAEPGIDIVFPTAYALGLPAVQAILRNLWQRPDCKGQRRIHHVLVAHDLTSPMGSAQRSQIVERRSEMSDRSQ